MLKRIAFIIGCAAIFFAPLASPETLAASGERIDMMSVSIVVDQSGLTHVTETIFYNSGGKAKHGIYRDITLVSAQGKKMTVFDVSVTDQNGNPEKFTASRGSENLELKIGDPNKTFSGEKTYVISYKVKGALSYLEDNFDEIYWNATGNNWVFPIYKATATVSLPQEQILQAACYYGPQGSKSKCDFTNTGASVDFSLPENTVLEPGDGMTVAVGFPSGLVPAPAPENKTNQFLKKYGLMIVPIVELAAVVWLWLKKGRDPKGTGTVVPEYEVPDNLTPLEAGVILRQRARNEDISAEIVYLAVRGYIKIERTEKKIFVFNSTDYTLTLLKSGDDLHEADVKLIKALFSSNEVGAKVSLSDLKNVFYKHVSDVTEAVSNYVVTSGYYPKNPQRVAVVYGAVTLTITVCVAVLVGFFASIITPEPSPILIGSLIAVSIIGSGFAFFMPAVTKKGAIARERIKGLKMYITVAEKDRINFHNAPEKKPELFEKLLPYAMLFGAETAWAKQFENIYLAPPQWYSDSHMGAFNAVALSHGLSSFSTAARGAFSSPSGGGSGGGGFSGGGGGGGGGGSW